MFKELSKIEFIIAVTNPKFIKLLIRIQYIGLFILLLKSGRNLTYIYMLFNVYVFFVSTLLTILYLNAERNGKIVFKIDIWHLKSIVIKLFGNY